MVLNKSADLAIKNFSDFRKYRKAAAKIKEPKFQWNQKNESDIRKWVFMKLNY